MLVCLYSQLQVAHSLKIENILQNFEVLWNFFNITQYIFSWNILNEKFPNFRDLIFELIIVKSVVDIGYRNCSNYFPVNPLKALHALYRCAQCIGQGWMDNIKQQVSKFLAFESTSSPVFFILPNFRDQATKKKGLANPTNGFLRF